MAVRNTGASWGWPARLLHWTGAALILFMLGLGFWTANFVPSLITELTLTQLHKSWGFVAFVLALVRVGWRWANQAPALPAGMPRWERHAARASHLLLYLLIVAMPLTGWLYASASPLNDPDNYPFQIKNMVFDLFELPDPFQPGSKALAETLGAVHFWTGVALSALIALHAAAALKHQFRDRDGLLRRMILG